MEKEKSKVIRVDFAKKKRLAEEPAEEKSADIGENLRNYITSRGKDDPLTLLFELFISRAEIYAIIDDIEENTKNCSQKTLSQRKEEMHSFNNNQLVKFLAESTPDEWRKNPAFYRAVVIEFKERLRILGKSLDD